MSRALIATLVCAALLTACGPRRGPARAQQPPYPQTGYPHPPAQPGPARPGPAQIRPAPADAGNRAQAVRAPFQQGKASYYHDSLAGNPTASGEPYDPGLLTAAHRKLRFGTVVDAVRSDGRWVRVRINDRGPFVEGRVIDLSRRAAEQIDLIRPGVADVTLYIVSQP